MDNKRALSPQDRQFFAQLARVIFLNPFSDERAQLDAEIARRPELAHLGRDERVKLFLPDVAGYLERFNRGGQGRTVLYAGDDRRLVEYAWLFYLYHQRLDAMDALIQAQMEQGDRPVKVPFAAEGLAQLRERGFSHDESLRFFELFFQLRRAFYFIEKGLVGTSPCMKHLRLSLWNSVFTHEIALYDQYLWHRMEDFSTLLLGETGSGKGTAAAAIGRSGCIPFDEKTGAFEESFTRTFLSINLSQYPESLIESELFGHRKGAFTGAMDQHDGIFSLCSPHGALFLDEIGEVPVPVQIKLLQVLQDRTFSPVGSHDKRRFAGRVIAATNSPLKTLRAPGRFRDDFFYRVSSDIITVPPLRLRLAEDPAELEDLIALTVQRIVGQPSRELTQRVCQALERDLPKDYAWPGNVRELEQAVRRILVKGAYAVDAAGAIPDSLDALRQGMEAGTLEARELLAAYCRLLYGRFGSYEEVARRTKLDRRTVKKCIADTQ